jgi:hypothetical protein
MIGPILDESAESYADRLSIAKVNVLKINPCRRAIGCAGSQP